MLIQLAEDVRGYVYDVFVTRFDAWLVFGILAGLFMVVCFGPLLALPLGELGGTLFGAGLLPVFFDLTHDA